MIIRNLILVVFGAYIKANLIFLCSWQQALYDIIKGRIG